MITLKEGEIFSSGLARGRVRSMKKVVDMTREYLDEVNANRENTVSVLVMDTIMKKQ